MSIVNVKIRTYINYDNFNTLPAVKLGILQEIHIEASHLQNSCTRHKY